MQPSPISPAPSQAAPRAQRPNNRKSASSQPTTTQTHQPRRSQRSPEQTHARHQSMPSQQRPSPSPKDMTNVTILKRSSATQAKTPSLPAAAVQAQAQAQTQTQALQASDKQTPANIKPHHHQQQQQQQQQQHRNHYPNQKPRLQSQQPLPSKARRVQRRKEIEATTESLAQVDIDLALNQSPPLDPSSPPSSSDSDDSESALSGLPDNMFAARRLRQLAGSPPQRPSSAPAVPQLRSGHQNVDTKPRHGDVYPSRASLTVDVQRNVVHTKTNSVDKQAEKKYAGPTFHNSPAPESLPIPVFARSAGNSPIEPAVEKLPPVPFFAEAASPQLNNSRPLAMQAPAPGWYGHYSMPMPMHYGVPETMATSGFSPQHMSGQYNGDQLMEISQNLRMLLKIQSQ